jgi:hypothetical protein
LNAARRGPPTGARQARRQTTAARAKTAPADRTARRRRDDQPWLPGFGKQPWLPGVTTTPVLSGTNGTDVVVSSTPGRLESHPTNGAAGTLLEHETEDEHAGRVVRAEVRAAERAARAELATELERQEWAADGGDGSICSTHEDPGEGGPDARALNLEWMLRGELLAAMATVTNRTERTK